MFERDVFAIHSEEFMKTHFTCFISWVWISLLLFENDKASLGDEYDKRYEYQLQPGDELTWDF